MLGAFVNLELVSDVVLVTTGMIMIVFFYDRSCVEAIEDSMNKAASVTSSINEVTTIIGSENFLEINHLCEPMFNLVSLELPFIMHLAN